MNTDDFTQPLESVMRQERMAVYPLPLKIQDRAELFTKWCELNPKTLRNIELTALAIHQRGMRVSTKYLIEKQRYEGSHQITGVPFFEANVRDYEGNVSVNKGIRETLEHPSEDDFWWLNNGVTILASEAYQIAGAEVKMEEPRIVNGLQTSYEIYKFMESRTEDAEDSRNVMVKILVPGSDETRNRVILATNNQTQVKKTSLRATDQIHIQIELYMKRNGLYYERRKNYYKNQGRKREEIVTLSFLAQCMMSILLGRPDQARARPSTLLSDEAQYKKIFGQDGNLEAYYRAASLGKQVCLRFPQIKRDLEGSQISDIRFYVIMGVASILSKKDNLTFGDIEKLDLDKLSDEIIQEVADMVLDVYLALGGTSKTAKSYAMATKVKEKISLQLP